MEKGFEFRPDFAASKDSGGRAEQKKREERELEFERMMGGPDSKIIKARNDLLDTRASGVGLTYEEIINAMVKAGYPKAFKEAVHAKGVKTGGVEWEKLTDELRNWCLLKEDNLPEKTVEVTKPAVIAEIPLIDKEKKERLNVRTVDDLNTEMVEINMISDPTAKERRLGKLADHLYDRGKTDWGNAVAEERTRQREKKNTANVIGLPKDKNSETEWRTWSRARLASLLDPTVGEVKNASNVFSVISETTFGRSNVDGSVYMPEGIRNEIVNGKRREDGRIEETSELQVSQEIGKIFTDWRKSHKKLGFMVSAIDGGEYRLPDNGLNSRLLNGLQSEDGRDSEGGSKNIAKAVQLYWAMAHSKEDEGEAVLRGNGLEGIIDRSIFNHQLSVEEISEIRDKIAEKCGGTYYENIGLMYACFYGVAAYGSDSVLPRIEFADAMGNLVHSEINRFDNDKDKFNSAKRGYRYLDDTVANALYEVKNGKKVVKNGQPVPVELSVDSGSLQEQVETKEPRVFYVLRENGTQGKFRVVKKIGVEGTDYANDPSERFVTLNTERYEEVLFEDLIKQGRINEIDWGHSHDFSPIMVSREKGAIYVYKMFKNLDDDLAKLNEATLIARRENFEDALPQYNIETQQNTMFLWLYSLIAKNRKAWTSEKKDEVMFMVKDAAKHRLISNDEYHDITKEFNLGFLGDSTKLFDGKTYTPSKIFKSLLGK